MSVSDIEFSDLPKLPDTFIHPQNRIQEIDIAHERQQGEQMLQQLNNDKRRIHDTIINAITTNSYQNCYFVMDEQEQVKPVCTTLLSTTYRHSAFPSFFY